MEHLRALGYLPDVPTVEDYDEQHREVAPLLFKTKLAHRVAPTMKAMGITAAAPAAPAAPGQVDLRQWCSPIEDQGQIGSCTANAAVGLLEYFERRAFNKYVDASRLFVYKTERDLLGWTGDTGAYLRTAMEALVLFGAPPERYWPYDTPKYDHPLPGGLVAYPAAGSHSRGGHANMAVGYDDNLMIGPDKGALLIRNSWGTG